MTLIPRILVLGFLLLALQTGIGDAIAAPGQVAAPASITTAVRATVAMPQDDAELEMDGRAVVGGGLSRDVEVPALGAGGTRQHTFTARWKPNSYTEMTRSKTITLRGGGPVTVDLASEDASDRVKVIYVPTPSDIAEQMVTLAGVTNRDVVYEPGCGDARITIAAIRRGAQRAICIDIDKERAEESRANVKAAGLADKIDVRLGDALDLEDLSEVTVVLLYMGDHFNMLVRPVLWRDLPVGSRIVSHRFTMGDWKPDRTLSVRSSEGGEYELHLWTITEEHKRRARASGR